MYRPLNPPKLGDLKLREFDGIKKVQGVEQASLWVLNQGKVFAVNNVSETKGQKTKNSVIF